MPQFPLVGGAYQSRSLNLDAQRCINLFPVLGESGNAKSVRALFGTPGLRRLATLAGGAIRGLYRPSTGDAIAVAGYNVYRVATDFTATLVGTIDSNDTVASIRDNGTTAVLVTGEHGYKLDLAANTLTEITDDGFYGATCVSYNDNSFILDRPNTNQFYISAADGSVTFDPLDFASAESNAEPIVSHIVNHGQVLLFKRTVTEVWGDSGNADFPYSRDGNALIEQGCAAAHSVVDLDNSVFWLGEDKNGHGVVWRLNGYTPQRVSHDGVEKAIQGYSDISDARAYAYQQEGETFYVLNFPSANATWVYGVKANLWHERAWRDPDTTQLNRHRSNCHMLWAGLHVVGDWENGALYALDLDCFDDDGDPLLALRSSPHVADGDYRRIRFHGLQVDVEAGVGLNVGQGDDPQMMVRWSDDGGHTWSNLRTTPMGRIGQYRARARVRRLGAGRDRVFEISISDPVKRVILGASVDAEGLTR
jgi:hypothetical protein